MSIKTITLITVRTIDTLSLFQVVRAWKSDFTVWKCDGNGTLVDINFTTQPLKAVIAVAKVIVDRIDALPSTRAWGFDQSTLIYVGATARSCKARWTSSCSGGGCRRRWLTSHTSQRAEPLVPVVQLPITSCFVRCLKDNAQYVRLRGRLNVGAALHILEAKSPYCLICECVCAITT